MCKSVENLAINYTIWKLLQKGKSQTEIADLLDLDLAEIEEAEKALLATAE